MGAAVERVRLFPECKPGDDIAMASERVHQIERVWIPDVDQLIGVAAGLTNATVPLTPLS